VRSPTRRTAAVAAATLGIAALVATDLAASTTAAGAATPDTGLVFHAHPPMVRASLAASAITPNLDPAGCLVSSKGRFACHSPQSIRAAYGIPDTVNGEPAGTGQTIVIVDAFGSPTVRQDLQTFSTTFRLPAATLDVIYPNGKPTWKGTANQVGWAQETSLDVQWAHAVAPGARIALVVAPTNYGDALNLAQRYAVDHHLGNVMSLSFGESESLIHGNSSQVAQAHRIYRDAKAAGMSVFASSGDDGSDNGAGYGNFSFPAADPLVTAVGGTNLYKGSGLPVPEETVWGDYADCPITCAVGPIGATGGAPSVLGDKKNGSDVAYNASVYTGVLTYLGFLGADSGFYYMGGTSAGSPQWAAATAIVDQAVGRSIGSVRDLAPGWAAAGALSDVTVGSNSTPTFAGGYGAAAGPDVPTGYGTPDVDKIIAAAQG
jgi:subtilase family serine protease